MSENNSNQNMVNYMSNEGDVFILGEFDETILQNVIPGLIKRINDISNIKCPEITIYINSPGGYCYVLYSLLTIIAMAKRRGIKIHTVNMGSAYSCGAFLFLAGDFREMYKYSTVLLHLGQQFGSVQTFKQMERISTNWKNHFENLVDYIKKKCNMPEEMIRKELEDDDFYIDAEKCLEYGIADSIIDDEVEIDAPTLEIVDGMTYTFDGSDIVFKAKVSKPKEEKANKQTKTKKSKKKLTKKEK